MKTILLSMLLLAACCLPAAHGQTWVNGGSNSFNSATVIMGNWVTSYNINITNFTAEPGEPGHTATGVVGAGKSAWWRWQAVEPGFCTVSTRLLEDIDNAVGRSCLSVYLGSAVNDLTRLGSSNHWSNWRINPSSRYSQVTFYAEPGKIYSFAVDGIEGSDINANRYQAALDLRFSPLAKKTYSGYWFMGTSDNSFEAGGIQVTTTATGAFSGKLVNMDKTYAFKGVFGLDSMAQVVFERPKKNGIPQTPMVLTFSAADEGRMELFKDGMVGGGSLYEKAVFNAGAPVAGTYAICLTPQGIVTPNTTTGAGTLSATVAAKGQVRCMGTLPDGTAYAFSTTLMKTNDPGEYAIFGILPMYARKGFALFVGTVENIGIQDRMEVFSYVVRPPPTRVTDVYYPNGLVMGARGEATPWTPPSGTRALGFLNPTGNGVLRITNAYGEIPSGNVAENVNLTTANKFVFASKERKPALTLNTKTGLVTGSITLPPLKPQSIRAILHSEGGVKLQGHVRSQRMTLPVSVIVP